MKNILIPLIAFLLVGFNHRDSTLTKSERAMAVKELTKTYKHLNKSLKGLSEAQLNYKIDQNSWSIAECTEHIALSEYGIFAMLEGLLKEPADPTKRSEVSLSDEAVLKIIIDRSNKVKAQESLVPKDKYGSQKAALEAFKSKRKDNIKFIKDTQDDFRNRYAKLPFGTIDAYQVVLFLSGHTERHVLQIEEIMAHENFPTK